MPVHQSSCLGCPRWTRSCHTPFLAGLPSYDGRWGDCPLADLPARQDTAKKGWILSFFPPSIDRRTYQGTFSSYSFTHPATTAKCLTLDYSIRNQVSSLQ